MTEQQSIKETLNVIRKALEQDDNSDNLDIKKSDSSVLILNQLVKDDGTINIISNSKLDKSDITKLLNNKLDNIFESYLTVWLDRNMPKYLEKYFKNKKI